MIKSSPEDKLHNVNILELPLNKPVQQVIIQASKDKILAITLRSETEEIGHLGADKGWLESQGHLTKKIFTLKKSQRWVGVK